MDQQETTDQPLVDFTPVPRRLQTGVAVVAALALTGCVVDGIVNGLTFALMARWAGIFVLAALLCGAVITAVHALGGADRAGRRGERLASHDVGLSPRRLEVAGEPGPEEGVDPGTADAPVTARAGGEERTAVEVPAVDDEPGTGAPGVAEDTSVDDSSPAADDPWIEAPALAGALWTQRSGAAEIVTVHEDRPRDEHGGAGHEPAAREDNVVAQPSADVPPQVDDPGPVPDVDPAQVRDINAEDPSHRPYRGH